MKTLKIKLITLSAIISFTCINTNQVDACTRIIYKGSNGIYMTARSMDWSGLMPTSLCIVPRGYTFYGDQSAKALVWQSKYGCVITEVFGGAPDGMNEKGLNANMLWCRGSVFESAEKTEKPVMVAGVWVQYLLSNYGTVAEAVQGMQNRSFAIVPMQMPGTDYSVDVHISISDATGDSAIFEFVNGELVVYHSPDYLAMTNEPTYEKQLAFNDYWTKIGGFVSLPGTNKPQDRFVRASFYSNVIPPTDNADNATAIAFSIIREVSVPIGISTPDRPNVSTTIWRVVADHKRKIFYFEDTKVLNSLMWIDLTKIDFSAEKELRRLDPTKTYNGEVTALFVPTTQSLQIVSQ